MSPDVFIRTNPREGTDLVWPPERFYWSVLDAPGITRAGVLPQGLRDEFQEDVPVPIEELHAVAAPTGDGRLVVCAAPRDSLAEVGAAALALVPESLPSAVAAPLDCRHLNLLVGEFEPRPRRRARVRRHLAAAAFVLAGAAIVCLGLLRRAEHWRSTARDADAAGAVVLAQVAPGGSVESVALELARLRPTTDAASHVRLPTDASPLLASLLAAWPAAVPSKPQSILVTPVSVSVSVSVEGDAAPFLQAFKPPHGWRSDEPRLNTAGSLTRLTMQMRPAQEGARP